MRNVFAVPKFETAVDDGGALMHFKMEISVLEESDETL
jgi:hypothetical protein